MLIKQIIGILFILLMLQQSSSGQSGTGNFPVHRDTYQFRISRESDMLVHSVNAVVKQLALHLTKAPDKTGYEVAYSYRLLSAQVVDGDLIFSFRLDIDQISGDIIAGAFNIADVLKPGIISFNLHIIGSAGQKLDTVIISALEPGKDQQFISRIKSKPEYFSGLTDVKITRVQFGYNEMQQTQVLNRLSAIKAYQAACMLSDSIQKDADVLNRKALFPSPEIAIAIFQLSGSVRILGQLYRELATKPGSSDPENLFQKQKILAYRVMLIQQIFLREAAHLKVRIQDENIQEMVKWWVEGQVSHFNDKRYPGFAAPVFYKLGKVTFCAPDLAFMNKSIALMIAGLGGEVTPRVYTRYFCDAAERIYLKQSALLSDEGRFTEAADLLGNSLGLCSTLTCMTCSDRIIQQQARAYYGTYYSYLGVARKALASNLPEIATGYVASAADFQKKNSRFIILNTEVKELSIKLADIWLGRGDIALESGRLTTALNAYEKAECASSLANSGKASDLISGKVKSVRQQLANMKSE